MSKLLEAIKDAQALSIEQSLEEWVDEVLEKYDLFGNGADAQKWSRDYVYAHSMNESLADAVATRAMLKMKKERQFPNSKLTAPDADVESEIVRLANQKLHRIDEGMRGQQQGVQGAFGKGPKPTPHLAKALEPHREGPYAVGWRGQSWEWYGNGEPGKGEGRYKAKGNGGQFTHINIPTHAKATELANKVDQDYKTGKFHEAHGVYGKHGAGYYVEYHGAFVQPHKEMGEGDRASLDYQQKGHPRWRAQDMSAKPTRSFKSLKESLDASLIRREVMKKYGWEWNDHGKHFAHKTKGGLMKTSKGWIHDMTPASAGGAHERTAHAGHTDNEMLRYVKGMQ